MPEESKPQDPSAAPAANAESPQPSAGGAEAFSSSPALDRMAAIYAFVKDHLRAAPLLAFFLIALAVTAVLNPAKVGLAIWGLAKLGMGGYVGYWIDRVVFPYARPHTQVGIAAGTAWKRRAVIVAAAIVAAALLP